MTQTLEPPPTTRAASLPLLVTAFVLVSLNLRVSFAGPGPLVPVLGLSHVGASVLTMLPVLCMGLFASFGVLVRNRFGEERALFLAMAILAGGVVIRSIGAVFPAVGTGGLFAGTVVAGAGIAVGNVITPVLAKKRFPAPRIGMMMGVYGLVVSVGAAVAAAISVPVYHLTGSTWLALGLALIPALFAIVALIPQLDRPHVRTNTNTSWGWLLRNPLAWSITGYLGGQSLLLYTLFAWLPSVYIARGVSQTTAGFYLSICALTLAIGGFVAPPLAARRASQRIHLVAAVALCFVGVLGILAAPVATAPVWLVVLGIGLGAGQTLPSMLFVLRTRDHHTATALSTKSQTLGYLIGATGPLLAAALYSVSDSWTLPLLGLLALLVVNGMLGLAAGRARYLEAPARQAVTLRDRAASA
ncbi:MFS transporter [Nocardia altamirensis]|uniref:MFS transporter n=1 Tax=Nocardia altamirensis TaxID=472158 RepID=UPI00084000BC|nr:MFS transporter [Nocardia altamirensis]